jgi:hypothetical protein
VEQCEVDHALGRDSLAAAADRQRGAAAQQCRLADAEHLLRMIEIDVIGNRPVGRVKFDAAHDLVLTRCGRPVLRLVKLLALDELIRQWHELIIFDEAADQEAVAHRDRFGHQHALDFGPAEATLDVELFVIARILFVEVIRLEGVGEPRAQHTGRQRFEFGDERQQLGRGEWPGIGLHARADDEINDRGDDALGLGRIAHEVADAAVHEIMRTDDRRVAAVAVGLILAAGPIAAGEAIGFERLAEKLLGISSAAGHRAVRGRLLVRLRFVLLLFHRVLHAYRLDRGEDAAAAAVGFGFERSDDGFEAIDFELMLVTLALGPRRGVGLKNPQQRIPCGVGDGLIGCGHLFQLERSTRPGRAQ